MFMNMNKYNNLYKWIQQCTRGQKCFSIHFPYINEYIQMETENEKTVQMSGGIQYFSSYIYSCKMNHIIMNNPHIYIYTVCMNLAVPGCPGSAGCRGPAGTCGGPSPADWPCSSATWWWARGPRTPGTAAPTRPPPPASGWTAPAWWWAVGGP